jgi:hypothetical protein
MTRPKAVNKMVLAQVLGDIDRQAPPDQKGDCGLGASVGRDHARLKALDPEAPIREADITENCRHVRCVAVANIVLR